METKEKDLAELQRMSVAELCRRRLELFGEEPRRRRRQHLTREIAWKLQAAQEGGLPEDLKQVRPGHRAELRLANPHRRQCGAEAQRAVVG